MSSVQENIDFDALAAVAEEAEGLADAAHRPPGYNAAIHCHSRDSYKRFCRKGPNSAWGIIFTGGNTVCSINHLKEPNLCRDHWNDWYYALPPSQLRDDLMDCLAKVLRQKKEKDKKWQAASLRAEREKLLTPNIVNLNAARVARIKREIYPDTPYACLVNGTVKALPIPNMYSLKPSQNASQNSCIGNQGVEGMVLGNSTDVDEKKYKEQEELLIHKFLNPTLDKVYYLNDANFTQRFMGLRQELLGLLNLPRKQYDEQMVGGKAKAVDFTKEIDSQLEKKAAQLNAGQVGK